MSRIYQAEDIEAYDYQLYSFGNLVLRGPEPKLEPGNYFSCIGAAQPFGRYVDTPYPAILAGRLGMECLNLGVGGAGPRLFLKPDILSAINKSRFAVVQILSGRSSSNSFFEATSVAVKVLRAGLFYSSPAAEQATLANPENKGRIAADPTGSLAVIPGTSMHAGQAYDALLQSFDKTYCDVLRQETKLRHALNTIELLRAITVPKVLLYLSEREPDVVSENYRTFQEFFGEFPHFVDDEFVSRVAPHADAFVKCVSTRGKPHKLPRPLMVKSPKGAMFPLEYNKYYPSPEMHEDAADALWPAIESLVQRA